MADVTETVVDLLRRGHAVRFTARGDSMHPVIREGDVLHVEPVAEVHLGDVVLILARRGLTAHRIVARDTERVVTRGDRAESDDEAVAVSQILGRVVFVERNGVRCGTAPELAPLRALRRLRRWWRGQRS